MFFEGCFPPFSGQISPCQPRRIPAMLAEFNRKRGEKMADKVNLERWAADYAAAILEAVGRQAATRRRAEIAEIVQANPDRVNHSLAEIAQKMRAAVEPEKQEQTAA